MLRLVLICLLLMLSRISVAAVPYIVDLSTLTEANLTLDSQIITDLSSSNPELVLQSPNWIPLARDQLRFGYGIDQLWLKSSFHTQGQTNKQVNLELYHMIRHSHYWLYQGDTLITHGQLDRYTPSSSIRPNTNIATLPLQVNENYTLLIHIYDSNMIVGSITLWDKKHYQQREQAIIYFIIIYTIFILAILIYNLIAFLSTQQKTFIFHAGYILSLFVLQGCEFNYLTLFFPALNTQQIDFISLICICIAYIALIAFVGDLLNHKDNEPFYHLADKLLIGAVIITIILIPFLAYKQIILLISYNILTYIALGLSYLIHAYLARNRYGITIVFILFIIFAPSATTNIAGRLGIIDVSLFSEYSVYFSIILEGIFVSIVLFIRLRSIRLALQEAIYIDRETALPNTLALKAHLKQINSKSSQVTLIYLWLSGLEKIEGAFGADFRLKYTQELLALMKNKLSLNNKTIPYQQHQHLFYCDSNKLALIGHGITSADLMVINTITLTCIDKLNEIKQQHLEVQPIVVGCEQKNRTIDELLNDTYHTLSYCIKKGLNNVLFYDHIGINERKQYNLAQSFSNSLINEEFFLHWQPQFNCKTHHIEGLEALVRWNHKELGIISPNEFIPILEKSLQIKDLTKWVIKKVLSQSAEIRSCIPNIELSINLSAHDVLDKNLLVFIKEQIHHHTVLAHTITLEITESTLLEDNEIILNHIQMLQNMGFKISIDDFGAGYASFGYLRKLPINEIKIDKLYIDNLHEFKSRAIVQSIIYLANLLGLKTVAEGVEKQQQIDILSYLGAKRLQGWKLGKPMLIEDITNNFNNQKF